jgi:hypothetical protein
VLMDASLAAGNDVPSPQFLFTVHQKQSQNELRHVGNRMQLFTYRYADTLKPVLRYSGTRRMALSDAPAIVSGMTRMIEPHFTLYFDVSYSTVDMTTTEVELVRLTCLPPAVQLPSLMASPAAWNDDQGGQGVSPLRCVHALRAYVPSMADHKSLRIDMVKYYCIRVDAACGGNVIDVTIKRDVRTQVVVMLATSRLTVVTRDANGAKCFHSSRNCATNILGRTDWRTPGAVTLETVPQNVVKVHSTAITCGANGAGLPFRT